MQALFALDTTNDYRLLYATSPSTDMSALPAQPNVRIRSLPLRERWQTIAWQRLQLPLWADVLAGGVDVFHSPDFALAPVRRARTVLTVHDLTFVIRPECAVPSLRRYLGRVVPRSTRRADRVLADSKATADDLVRLYGLPANRLEVVYSAADARFRRLPEAEAEALLGDLTVPRPFILTVGTLEPRKNLGRLVDAFLSLNIPHALVVAGARGWLYDELMAKLRQPRIQVLDRPTDDQLVGLYNLTEAFIMPSLYEGFGLPALEAMSCGAPVAVSNVSSLPEVVGEAGLTFDPEDTAAIGAAIRSLTSEPALRSELSAAGVEQAASFSWRTSALQLKAIYESLG